MNSFSWQLRKLLPDSALASHGLLTMREEWNARRASDKLRAAVADHLQRPEVLSRSPRQPFAPPSHQDSTTVRELLLSVQRSQYREGAPLDDAGDLRAFLRGVRNSAYGCDGFLLGVADLCGVPIVVDSIASETGVRRMAQITWPTEVAAPRYVLHLFLQHDKHCVAIARVAAAADGLGHRCLRPKPRTLTPPPFGRFPGGRFVS